MDNLTHSLVGWALGQTGLKTRTRKGLAALVLGANMPDIDVFFGWAAWAPLATHRGWTHSLVGGVLLMPPLLAALLWGLDRWQMRRGAEFKSGLAMHFGWLVVLSYLGALSHPLLDWQTSYAIQLLSPFDSRWYHTDSLFIIDVWIWSALAIGIWMSRRGERAARANWGKPAAGALALLVAYVAANGMLSVRAKAAPLDQPVLARPDVIVATPPPVLFWRREVLWRQEGAIARGSFDPLRSLDRLENVSPPTSDGMADPLARRGMTASREVVAFMRWSILPMAQVERGRCSARVLYEDARFGGRPTIRTMRLSASVPLPGEGCPRRLDAPIGSGS